MKHTFLAAASVLALALTAPAHAAEAEQTAEAASAVTYILSVRHVSSGETRVLSLQCDPAGGTHPEAEAACAAIAEGGSIEGAKGSAGACPMIHDPVVATASGAEDYRREFANDCVLRSQKGAVFAF